MKIVIIGPAYPFRGGLASFNERLAAELQRLGHQVVIHTFTKQYPKVLFPGKTQFSESAPPPHLTIKRSVHAYNPLTWGKSAQAILAENPDLLVTRFWMPYMGPALGNIIKRIKRKAGIPAVSIVDNIIPHEARPGDKPLTKYFVKQIDRFVVLSKHVGRQMKEFVTGRPIDFAPHPVYDNYGTAVSREAALARLSLDPSYRYILFFGFIRDYKGLDLLLEAMATDILRKRNIKLIIAGEYYSDEGKYKDLIDRLGIAGRLIQYNGFIPNEEVKYYFSAADLVVQPYKSATQSGISQIAMHFGVPMVVTGVGGLKEIVKDGINGYIAGQTPASVADCVVRFFDENKAGAFREQILQDRKAYEWEHFARVLLGEISVPVTDNEQT